MGKEPVLKMVFAGALGSILGTLLLDAFRSKDNKALPEWLFWFVLIVIFTLLYNEPLSEFERKLRHQKYLRGKQAGKTAQQQNLVS